MKSPVDQAKSLTQKHGPKKAWEIADSMVKTLEVVGTQGVPYDEEVTLSERVETSKDGKPVTRIITVIDEPRRALRLLATLVYWKNTAGYLKKRKPQEA